MGLDLVGKFVVFSISYVGYSPRAEAGHCLSNYPIQELIRGEMLGLIVSSETVTRLLER